MTPERRIVIYLFRVAILFAAYFFVAQIGLGLTYSAKQITLVWSPAGIALAAMLLWGLPVAPGIFLGAFAVNFSTSGFFLSSFGIAIGNTIAALIGAFLLRRIKGFDTSFINTSDYLRFILFGAVIPPIASATVGVGSLMLSHAISIESWSGFFSFFRLWWFGDMVGILIFAPIFLVWPHVLSIKRNRTRFFEAAVLFFASAIASFFIFNSMNPYFGVMLPPFTLWAAVRFYQPGAAFMTFLLSAIAIFGTVHGTGPFASFATPEEGLFFSQIFNGVMAIASMIIALVTFEGKKAVEEWKKLSLLLHERIAAQSEKLAARAEELQEYIDHMSIFTAKIGLDGSFLVVSKSTEAASGMPREALMKTNFLDGQWWAFDPEVQSRVRAAFHRAVSGEAVRYDEEVLAHGTKRMWINLCLIPVLGKDGKTAFVIAEGLNITERKTLENALALSHRELEKKIEERTTELNSANEALKEEVSLRDRFLATLSHELRNPLSPIISAAETLRLMTIQDEETRKLFEIIERQANQMARLLKDLLDLSRISNQKIELNFTAVDMKNVLNAAVETTRPLFLNREHDLSVSFPEHLILQGDALRLEQIIVNLLNNAAKYTPKGGRISLRARSENGNAIIAVRDDGIGISANIMPKIFNLFAQDEKTLHMTKGGLGIGLALAKALAELHGGEITAKSAGADKGATFEVSIPLKRG